MKKLKEGIQLLFIGLFILITEAAGALLILNVVRDTFGLTGTLGATIWIIVLALYCALISKLTEKW